MTAPFELKHVTKRYGALKAIDNVSIAMKDGEILGLLGANGAGKTSLISLLNTLEKPSSGEARVFGELVGGRLGRLRLGVVPQEIVSHGFFTLAEVLHYHSGLYGVKNNQKHIDFLLQRLELTPHRDKRVSQLSGGMRRRLLIAKALVHQPKLLLLDEPTAGVDIELRASLWKFVKELNEEHGVSILLTTHYLEEAEELCHRIGILDHGRLLKLEQTKTLIGTLTTRRVELVLNRSLPAFAHSFLIKQETDRLIFATPHDWTLSKLLHEVQIPVDSVSDVHIHEGSLEDAFLKMVVK